jgi:hypothetical protein
VILQFMNQVSHRREVGWRGGSDDVFCFHRLFVYLSLGVSPGAGGTGLFWSKRETGRLEQLMLLQAGRPRGLGLKAMLGMNLQISDESLWAADQGGRWNAISQTPASCAAWQRFPPDPC